VTEKALIPINPNGPPVNVQFYSNVSYGLSNLQFPVQIFQEQLSVTSGSGTVLATFGGDPNAVAVVENRYGNGKTLFIGTFLGLAVGSSPSIPDSLGAVKTIQGLVTWANVSVPVNITYQGQDMNSQVEVRLLKVSKKEIPAWDWLVIVINRSGVKANNFLLVLNGRTALSAWDVINNNMVPVQPIPGGIQMLVDLSVNAVAVYTLSGSNLL